MVREAEEYAEEDKAVKDRIDARNSLESYLYNMKNLLDDEEKGVSDKISEADKEVREKKGTSTSFVGLGGFRCCCFCHYVNTNVLLQGRVGCSTCILVVLLVRIETPASLLEQIHRDLRNARQMLNCIVQYGGEVGIVSLESEWSHWLTAT